MQPLPDGFDIPLPFLNQSFHIYFYGILIMLGVVAAAFRGQADAKRRGINPDYIWDALFWVVLAGIVGARLWHIFTPQADMLVPDPSTGRLVNPYFAGGVPRVLDMINIRQGGLGIPGAIIGGALALWFYCRKKKISFLTLVDIVIPGVALAQAIGRWGNFFNQELYGLPTTFPLKIFIDPAHRLSGFETVNFYQPLFAYESLLNFASMIFLLWLSRRFAGILKAGDLFLVYLGLYSLVRFLLEFLRLDVSLVNGFNINQVFFALVFVCAGIGMYSRHRTVWKL